MKQLELKFMKDVRKRQNRGDLKLMGKIFAGPLIFLAMATMPIWGQVINHYFPDRFHKRDAIARYVEPLDGLSKGAVYQGFDSHGNGDVDSVHVHRVYYVGKVIYVPPAPTVLTEASGTPFYEAKNLLENTPKTL